MSREIVFLLSQQKTNVNLIKVSKNNKFCNVIMPCNDNKIFEFVQYQKSGKTPFFIYADIKRLLGKIKGCKTHPEN